MPQLRVASFNLYLGADLSVMFGAADPDSLQGLVDRVHQQLLGTDFPSRASAIARLLARERVDVVGLQEVARWTRSSGGAEEVWCDFLTELLAALEGFGTAYDVHAVNHNFRGGAPVSETKAMAVLGANVTLVRRGSGVQVTGERTGEFSDLFAVPTGIQGLVFPIHRSWGLVEATVDGQAFRFVNTHLEAYDAPTRDAQRDELLSVLHDVDGPVLVTGDFNARPEALGMPVHFQDAWAVAGGPGPGPTCGQAADLAHADSRLGERIDYVFVRDGSVSGCRVVGNRAEDRTPGGLWPSDHACVVADVAW